MPEVFTTYEEIKKSCPDLFRMLIAWTTEKAYRQRENILMNDLGRTSEVSVDQYGIWSDIINADQNAIPVNWSDNWQDEWKEFIKAELDDQALQRRKACSVSDNEAEWSALWAEFEMRESSELHARRQFLTETVWRRKLKIAKLYGFRPIDDEQKEWISPDGVVFKDHQLVGHINWLRRVEKADTTRKERKRRKHNSKSAWRALSNELTEHLRYIQECIFENSAMAYEIEAQLDDEVPFWGYQRLAFDSY